MKLEKLFERALVDVSPKDIYRFKRFGNEPDIAPEDIQDEETMRIKDKIERFIRNGRIKIYRAITTPENPVMGLLRKPLVGMSWTYDMGAAETYRGRGYGDEYILEAEIDERYIDWDRTIALNTVKIRGNYEREIRLFKGTPIRINRIYASDGAALREIDIDEIKNKVFKVR